MELEAVKKLLDKGEESAAAMESLPPRFFEHIVMKGLRVDHIEPGRLICSFTVPSRLLNAGNFLHGGRTAMMVGLAGSAVIYTLGAPIISSVSIEVNVSYLDAAHAGNNIFRMKYKLRARLYVSARQSEWSVLS